MNEANESNRKREREGKKLKMRTNEGNVARNSICVVVVTIFFISVFRIVLETKYPKQRNGE